MRTKHILLAGLLAVTVLCTAGCGSRTPQATETTEATEATAETTVPETTVPETTVPETTAEPTETTDAPAALSGDFPLKMSFPVAGGTSLTLEQDGSCSYCSYSEDFDTREDGSFFRIRTLCSFSGKFADIRLTPDGIYTMTFRELAYEKPLGEYETDTGTDTYVATTRFQNGSRFLLMPPDTPAALLPQDSPLYSVWNPMYGKQDTEEPVLLCWILTDPTGNSFFFTQPPMI